MRVYRLEVPPFGGPTFRDLKQLYEELDTVLHPGSTEAGEKAIIHIEEMAEDEYEALPEFEGY